MNTGVLADLLFANCFVGSAAGTYGSAQAVNDMLGGLLATVRHLNLQQR